ncbi:MaoC family dehydratase N-terminal domain-containing protein [Nereida sp. MMG025]|uniref:FAS1-like dehydratase domain-containing protein n=1 Tax=Nereida sp. MMG025 TaxID=2909981 RepID=UPI001F2E0F16|nr:MaoC family dehydratase N-terminal domain-containing protein [Nereida sp. MMG025]MCF6444213.1 MaoC family dehydratase N-terminal domain-containing protein [Nereida sp. MMG025]
MSIDLDHLRTWVGKTETRDDLIHPFPANAMAATLDRERQFENGDPLPPLWHWLHFLPVFTLKDAGHDGHAALGGFLPPVPLPRRMWAGGRLSWHRPIHIGQVHRKISKVLSVEHKQGRSGDLVFVTVRHQIYSGDERCLSEEHDIVYRAQEISAAQPPLAPTDGELIRHVNPDPVLLFRYSALTFNGHRIHYDHPFATTREGYGGLIVHGPLLASYLCGAIAQKWPTKQLARFAFKAKAPVFDTMGFDVCLRGNGDNADLWITRDDGVLAMEAEATLA